MVAYQSLMKIIADAKDLGVPDRALAPLQEFTARNAQLTKVLDTIEKRNHVADAFANGTDLAAALKAEADDRAIYERAAAHSTALTDLVGSAMLDVVDDPKNTDPLLLGLSKVLQPAESALNRIAERWGSENPDAAQVAAEATPAELKEYRARGEHVRTRKRVYAILEKLFATTAGYGQGRFPMVIVPTGGGGGEQLLRWWLITEDGTIRSQHQVRCKLNAFRSLEELSRHDGVLTNPKPAFKAKYAVATDRLDQATFDRDGAPTNPDNLMTPDEYFDLFGTSANDDRPAQSRSSAADEYLAELGSRKDN